MCGIVGFNWADKALVKKMSDIIFHRGPDHGASYVDGNISIGYRRLSIVDLSNKGCQPIFNEKRDKVIVFNGEIYNYKLLKEELIRKGHKFSSETDTEAIIHGYEEFGENICSRLKGMFAFAIWDKKKKTLILARDHIGEKPLYYFWDGKRLIFGSEIKSILLHDIKRSVNAQNLADYLSLRFSPSGNTMFRGIKKLEPGHLLFYANEQVKIKKFWELPAYSSNSDPSIEKLGSLIDSVIKEKLMADVPLGVFLSGGLDSSTVVSFLSDYIKNIKTFSIGFNDSTDETKYAELVSRKFNTDHKEIIADKDSSLSFLPEIVWHLDEPMADPASLPTYLLSKEVSKNVKVALSGEGGDEVFGGYDSPNLIKSLNKIHKIPGIIRRHIASPFSHITSNIFGYPRKQKLQLLSDIFRSNDLSENYKMLFYLPFSPDDKQLFLSNELKSLDMNTQFDRYLSNPKNLLEGTYNYYFEEWLPNDLLMKTDKMGMAHSLEIRAPFLDKELVEYSCGLHWKYKYRRALFRKVVEKRLPKEILNRKKQGFTLPLSRWFTSREFMGRTSEHLKDLRRRGFFDLKAYNSLISRPLDFRSDHRLWVLLNLELWCKEYLDNISPKNIKL